MNKWIEEALRAPRDAVALLLGLVTAFSIFALVRHEFASEPVRVVLANFSYWSHSFWQAVGNVLSLKVSPVGAGVLTSTALVWTVFARGLSRGQAIEFLGRPVTWRRGLLWAAVFFLAFVTWMIAVLAVISPLGTTTDDGPFVVVVAVGSMLLLCPLGITLALTKTPRSFFGVVIAGLLLLMIDRIPILPAATGG